MPFSKVTVGQTAEEYVEAFNGLGQSVLDVHDCLHTFREESLENQKRMQENQDLIMSNLKINHYRRGQLTEIPGKTMATMSQAGNWYRIATIVFLGMAAAPLMAKIVNAMWHAVALQLLK